MFARTSKNRSERGACLGCVRTYLVPFLGREEPSFVRRYVAQIKIFEKTLSSRCYVRFLEGVGHYFYRYIQQGRVHLFRCVYYLACYWYYKKWSLIRLCILNREMPDNKFWHNTQQRTSRDVRSSEELAGYSTTDCGCARQSARQQSIAVWGVFFFFFFFFSSSGGLVNFSLTRRFSRLTHTAHCRMSTSL